MPYHQGRNEQAMVHAAVGYARQRDRLVRARRDHLHRPRRHQPRHRRRPRHRQPPARCCCCPATPSPPGPPTRCSSSSKCPTRATCRSTTACARSPATSTAITRPEALIPAALQAMRVLADPVDTGAVTLALPQDVQAEAYDWPEEFFAERVWRVRRPGARPGELAEAVRAVRAARRPLIVAGGGVHHSRAEEALARARRRHRHPGRLHPGRQGLAALRPPRGRRRHRPHRHRHRRRTGPHRRPGHRRRHPLHRLHHRLRHPLRRARRPLPQPQHRRRSTATSSPRLPLVADARTGLEALDRGAARGHRVDAAYVRRVHATTRSAGSTASTPPTRPRTTDVRPTQPQVLGALDALVTEDDILINAAGSLPGDLHKLWRARSRDQYHLEYGYSCMGYEIPAAIGVAAGRPRPARLGAGRRRHVSDDADRDRHRRPGGHRRSRWSSSRTTATPPSAACPSRSGGERFGTAYRFRAADGTYTGAPLPVDLAANAASLGMHVLRAKTVA